MSYTRKEWKTGDRINAEDLNRIEEGIIENYHFVNVSKLAYSVSSTMITVVIRFNPNDIRGGLNVLRFQQETLEGFRTKLTECLARISPNTNKPDIMFNVWRDDVAPQAQAHMDGQPFYRTDNIVFNLKSLMTVCQEVFAASGQTWGQYGLGFVWNVRGIGPAGSHTEDLPTNDYPCFLNVVKGSNTLEPLMIQQKPALSQITWVLNPNESPNVIYQLNMSGCNVSMIKETRI